MIRLLTEEERIQAVQLYAESESCGALHPEASLIGAVTDEGEVVAILGVEQLVFLGPLIVKKGWRGKQIPYQLVEYVQERVPEGRRVGVYTSNRHVMKLAGEFEMKKMPGEFFMAEV